MSMLLSLLGFLCILSVSVVHSLKPPEYRGDIDIGKHGSYPVQKFVSSKLKAPLFNFLQWHPECDDRLYYFITPRGWKVSDPGPMILDGAGQLIWSKHFDNEFGGQAYDLKVQKYRGEDYLTFWLGDDTIRGHGVGHYYMLNSSYDVVYKVGAVNGKHADLHDFLITPEGTALLLIFQPVKADVRPLGRKFNDVWNQAVWDCLFQEIDIQTGELIFEWRASEHLDLTLTYHKLTSKMGDSGTSANAFDWFHINSVNKDELGNYLISSRNLHAVLYIDGKTKNVIWTIGGKKNDFQDLSNGHALNFAWQHDAQFVSPDTFPEMYKPPPERPGFTTNLLTMFDNAAMDWNYAYGPSYSRVLLLEVSYPVLGSSKPQSSTAEESKNLTSSGQYAGKWLEALSMQDREKVEAINGTNSAYTVRVVHEYINPKRVISSTQGSVQVLPQQAGKDPNLLVGYGINAVITEFSSNASVLCDMHFAAVKSWEKGDVQSYRAYKFPWVGRPSEKPTMAVRNGRVWASWNGATEHVEWVLQASGSLSGIGNWEEVARVPRTGFETSMPLRSSEDEMSREYLRVLAICQDKLSTCENGISEVFHNQGLLPHTGEALKNIDVGYGSLIIIVIGFVAISLVLTRFTRCRLPRWHFKSDVNVLPRQRVD